MYTCHSFANAGGSLRELLKNAAFTLVVWALLFAVAELGLRGWEAVRPPGAEWTDGKLFMCEPDPHRIWRYKAGFRQAFRTPEFAIDVRTSSWRLRDGEVGDEELRDPGVLRVLAVGDSFFFGWGVEESERFTERLQSRFAAEGTRVAFLNAGHWSYAYDQELLLLRELVPRYRPHLVMVGYYPPGVVAIQSHRWDRDGQGRLEACRNDGIRVAAEGSLHFTNDYLERAPFSSRVISAAFRVWFNWRLSREAMTGDTALLDPAATRYGRGWAMTEDVLRETGAFLESEGVPWLAVGVPRDLQVSPEEWNERYRGAVADAKLDLDLPMTRLGPLVERAGGQWVDLLPGFRAVYAPDLYFGLDPHWTPRGHALVATLLASPIREALARRGGTSRARASRDCPAPPLSARMADASDRGPC